jgi:hypothetical protein
LARDASWFPASIASTQPVISFVRTSREDLAAQAFLDDALWDTRAKPHDEAGLAELTTAIGDTRPAPLHVLWHTAFCCSTLLARLLDKPGKSLALREPNILVSLASAKRLGWFKLRGAERIADIVFRLLGRRFAPEEQVIVKPTSPANTLIRDAADITSGKMIFLFSDCPSFLISVALKGEARRAWTRRAFNMLSADGHEPPGWRPDLLFEMSDLQIAALVWHMQMAEFSRSIATIAPDRVASLDCDMLLAAPTETLAKLDGFLGLGLGGQHIEELASGPLMSRDAKSPNESFSPAQRREALGSIDTLLKKDVAAITAWSYEICRTARGYPLPNPLLAPAKAYGP